MFKSRCDHYGMVVGDVATECIHCGVMLPAGYTAKKQPKEFGRKATGKFLKDVYTPWKRVRKKEDK